MDLSARRLRMRLRGAALLAALVIGSWEAGAAHAATRSTRHAAMPAVVAGALDRLRRDGVDLPLGGPATLPVRTGPGGSLSAQTAAAPDAWSVTLFATQGPYAVNSPKLRNLPAAATVAGFGVSRLAHSLPRKQGASLAAALERADLVALGMGVDAFSPLIERTGPGRRVTLGHAVEGVSYPSARGGSTILTTLVWREQGWTLVVRLAGPSEALATARQMTAYLGHVRLPAAPGLVVVGFGAHGTYARIDWAVGRNLFHLEDDGGETATAVQACEMAVAWRSL